MKKYAFLIGSFIIGLCVTHSVEAATLYQVTNEIEVTVLNEFTSEQIEISDYQSLFLYFDYDITALDKTPSQDSLVYGYQDNLGFHELGTIYGESGVSETEISNVGVELPQYIDSNSIQIVMYIVANSLTTSDQAIITNMFLTGETVQPNPINTEESFLLEKGGKVEICHFDTETESFIKISIALASVVKGSGHSRHGDDIIPAFWYADKAGEKQLFLGNDWNLYGKNLYGSGCLE